MLCYVDDLFHIGFNTKEDMDTLNLIYWLKEGFGSPDQYLCVNVEKIQLKDELIVWFTKFVDYLKSAIKNVNNSIEEDKAVLNKYDDSHRTY